MLNSICAICFGATFGSLLRWRLAVALNARFPELPPGTLAANLLGGYLIGIAMGVFAAFPALSPEWKLLTVTGFLGGLTTFSTFSAEVVTGLLEGRSRWVLSTIGAHVGGSIGMTLLGVGTVRLVLLTLALSATGAASRATPVPSSEAALTLQQLMAARIDPAADALWDSVAFIASTSGVEDRRPRTPAQWQSVRASALQLIGAAKILQDPGLQVGSSQAAPGIGELASAEIRRRVAATHEVFALKARNLVRTARTALASIDARDAEGLMAAGGEIDDACEACHVIYWYPEQAASRR